MTDYCQQCGNDHEDATLFKVVMDGELYTLDLGCVADFRLAGRHVETNPSAVRKAAA